MADEFKTVDEVKDARAVLTAISDQLDVASHRALARHGMEWCRVCGQEPARQGIACQSCQDDLEYDRLERESGR